MTDLMRDVRHATRRLVRTPMFTLATLLTLALGIGANVAIFSIVNTVLLKPLPFHEADRLVGLWQTAPGVDIDDLNASLADYITYREESRTLADVALWNRSAVTVTGLAQPERVDSLSATHRLLPLLGVQPAIGRPFSERDDQDGSPEVVMLSHGYWQRQFGGDRNVVGQLITVDGTRREIIGVLPRGFWFMDAAHDLVLPIRFNRANVRLAGYNNRAVGRLRPGVDIAGVNADVARMIRVAFTKFPPPQGMTLGMMEDARLAPKVRPLVDDLVGDLGKSLWVVTATIGIVLLIACANVANLLLVRTEGRAQEFAVRAAIGASRVRLARDVLAESLLLGLVGGAVGLGLAALALRAAPRAGAGAPAAPRSDRRRRGDDRVHAGHLDRRRLPVRCPAGDQVESCPAERGVEGRRTRWQRRSRSQHHPQHADGRPGGAGRGAADRIRPDAPHLPVDAPRAAGVHRSRDAPDAADRDPARGRGRRCGAAARASGARRAPGESAGRHLRRADRQHADGRRRQQRSNLRQRPHLCPRHDPAAAPVHPGGPGYLRSAGDAGGGWPRVRLERHPRHARRRADQRELRARVLGIGRGGDRQADSRQPQRGVE